MTLYQFLRTLTARIKIIVASVVTLLILLGIMLLVVPPKFTATSSVVVSSQSQDPLVGALAESNVSDSFVATQAEIISSPSVARKVVSALQLDKDTNYIDAWRDDTNGRGDVVSWIADTLAGGLKVAPGRNSNLIEIEFTSKNARFAESMANAFAKAYLDTSTELKIEPARQSARFFDVRIAELRGQLEQAQSRLADAQKQSGILVSSERLDVETSHLADLTTQLSMAQSEQADSTSRSRGAAGNSASSPDVIQNGVVQQLKTQIALADSKQKQLESQLGPNHPQYKAAQQEIDNLRASLAAESARVGSSLNTASRVGVDRASDLQIAVDQQRQRILDLTQKRDQLAVLQKEVDNADKAYQLVMERYAQTSIESHVALPDVAMLTSASEPTTPSFPRVKLFFVLAILFGVFLGVGIALLAEIFNPMVHSAEDVLLHIGIPVFVVVPAVIGRRARIWRWMERFRRRELSPARA